MNLTSESKLSLMKFYGIFAVAVIMFLFGVIDFNSISNWDIVIIKVLFAIFFILVDISITLKLMLMKDKK